MTISEIRRATVVVHDLTSARRFYERTFDYISHGEIDVVGAGYESLWNMPAGLAGKSALLGPVGATTGLLQLVQFDRTGQRIWGDYQHTENYGHYALNVRVPRIQPAIDKILAHGGRSKSKPTHWTVSAEVSAWDSLSYDPDGVILDVFELEPAAPVHRHHPMAGLQQAAREYPAQLAQADHHRHLFHRRLPIDAAF